MAAARASSPVHSAGGQAPGGSLLLHLDVIILVVVRRLVHVAQEGIQGRAHLVPRERLMFIQIGIDGAPQDVGELGGATGGRRAEAKLPDQGNRLARGGLQVAEVERQRFPVLGTAMRPSSARIVRRIWPVPVMSVGPSLLSHSKRGSSAAQQTTRVL